MELTLTEDQSLFHETTVRFIESTMPVESVRALHDDAHGWQRDWWRQAGELGWFTMLVPESAGGGSVSGNGVADAAIIAEEIGRHVQPGPFVPVNVVAAALAADAARHAALLGAVMAGEQIATWAFSGVAGTWDLGAGLRAERAGDGYRLTGSRGFVQDAVSADVLLVVASLDGLPSQFVVDAAASGIRRDDLECLDLSRRMSTVHFDGVEVGAEAMVGDVDCVASLEHQLDLAVALTAAESVGAMDAMMTMTVEYAKDRVAFGRPIGSFQSLKHVLADEAMYLETCKAGACAAARAVGSGAEDASMVASSVAAYVGDMGDELAQSALQVHGGIGFTWEHDLHLFMRRVRSNAALYGEPTWHRERLCRLHGLGEGSAS